MLFAACDAGGPDAAERSEQGLDSKSSLLAGGPIDGGPGGPPPPGSGAPGVIDRTDTHLTAQVTVEYTGTSHTAAPVYPAGSNTPTTRLSLASPVESYTVEAGYDSDGHIVLTQQAVGSVPDPTVASVSGVGRVRVARGEVAVFDRAGRPLGEPMPLDAALDGNDLSGLSLLDGVLLDDGAVTSLVGRPGVSVRRSGDVTTVTERFDPAKTGPGSVEQVREYRRSGAKHVLQRATTTATEPDGRGTARAAVQFSNVQWHQNAGRDDLRRSGARRPPPSGGAASTRFEEPGPGEDCNYHTIAAEPCGPPPVTGNPYAPCETFEDGTNVVFQHGINATRDTWGSAYRGSRVRSYVRCAVALDEELIPTLGDMGNDRHDLQEEWLRDAVRDRANDTGEGQFVFIGHSQGGLISRRVAQDFHASPTERRLVRGVITVGTPHRGANVARNASAIATFAGLAEGALSIPVVRIPLAPVRGGLRAVSESFFGSDAMNDLKPGSLAIREVNGPAEHFPRIGIQHYVSKRWVFARLAGDLRSAQGATGREYVTTMDATVGALGGGAIVAAIFGGWGVSAALYRVGCTLVNLDALWHRLTAGSQQTDGVVEGPSQVYRDNPGSSGTLLNRQAREPTSHMGETRYETSAREIFDVLADELGSRRQSR